MTLENLEIRKLILRMTGSAGAAHIATSFSEVEILNAIYKSMDIDKIKNQSEDRDRLVLDKGHGAAGLYAVLYEHGILSKKEIDSFFSDNSVLAGLASHSVNGVEHSTGSLGHGLPVALGMALGSRSKGYNNRIFSVVSDGGLHEGASWEAIMYAGHQSLSNFCLMVDNNGKTMTGNTDEECSLNPLKEKFEAFGYKAFDIDGHNESEILQTIQTSQDSNSPVAVVCNTIKGKGVSFMENNLDWHYRPAQGEDFDRALAELEGRES